VDDVQLAEQPVLARELAVEATQRRSGVTAHEGRRSAPGAALRALLIQQHADERLDPGEEYPSFPRGGICRRVPALMSRANRDPLHLDQRPERQGQRLVGHSRGERGPPSAAA
jgi:hypothetical protein